MPDIIMKTKSLEQQLTESRNKFQAVFDGIPERIVFLDRRYKILAINRFTLQLIGQDFREVEGKFCHEVLHCPLYKGANCAAKKAFATGEVSTITYSDVDKDGKDLYLDIRAFPLKDQGGRIIQVIEHTRDISEVKRLQNQLLQSEKMAAIGSLATGIAHELRNPLAIMTSAAQYCLTQIGPDETLRENLNIIINSAQSANRVVKELLDFAKPSEPRFKPASITEIIHEACSLIKSRRLKQKVGININCNPDLPKIGVSREHLEQALVNFLVNSLDAMEEGGDLTINAERLPGGRFITIRIIDTGCGIPKGYLSQAFDPFFTTKKSGIGLGMSVGRRIVESHGGRVSLESTVGKGTTVTINLPIT